MKKTIPFLVIILLTVSCKTIFVTEKMAFQESKYNIEKYKKNINNSSDNQAKKDSSLFAIDNVVSKNDEKIQTKHQVELRRQFTQKDNLSLEYFIFQPKSTDKIALFFLGNGSNIFSFSDNLFELSNRTNTKIYVLNYRGYGKSEGSPTFKTQFEDDIYFYNMILATEKKIDYVIGYSLGSIFATYLTTEKNINNLVLLSPFSNSNEFVSHLKKQNTKGLKSIARPFLKITGDENLFKLSNEEKLKSYKGKLLIFHGTDDKLLSYKGAESLFKVATTTNKNFHTIKNGNHGSPFNKENWSKLITEVNNM